jgi:hypothetical protein
VNDSASPTTDVPEGPTAVADDDDFLDSGMYDAAGAPGSRHGNGPADAVGSSDADDRVAEASGSGGFSGVRPYGEGTAPGSPAGWKSALRPAALLAAGVVAGVVAVAAWHSSQSTTPLPNPAAAQGQFPGGGQGPNGQLPNGQQLQNGQVPNGQGPNGQGPNGAPGFGGPGFGGRNGEQHVNGTATAVGALTITVHLASGGTATYTVVASSEIVKNGAPVSLSAVKVGDAVFLHVYPLNGKTVVERLFDGLPGPGPGAGPGSGPGGAPGDGSGQNTGNTDSGTTTNT